MVSGRYVPVANHKSERNECNVYLRMTESSTELRGTSHRVVARFCVTDDFSVYHCDVMIVGLYLSSCL